MTLDTLTLPKELGTARHVGTFENGSELWHQQRATGIGGSDVGVLCGLSKWESPYTWVAKRLGKIPSEIETSEPMEWGTRLEAPILDAFIEKHPQLTVYRDAGSWHHQDRPWQLANPDAIYQDAEGNWGIVEVKTARYEDDWDEKQNTIPATYRAQVLWYLQTFGFQHAYVVVLFSGSKFRVFEVTMNDFEADTNLSVATEFKKLLDEQTLPPFSAPYNSTFETVRYMHPDIEDTEAELGMEGVAYFEAVRDLERAQADVDLCKSEILQLMGKAKRGMLNGQWVLTRQARNGGTPYLVNKRG